MIDSSHVKLNYERRADETVLLIQIQDDEIDILDSQILFANTIPHLLPVAIQERDAQISLEFRLGRHKPLSEWLRTQHISDERLLHFLLHIGDMLWRLRDYLLIENRLLLLPEAMYIQDQLLDVKFVYWPDRRTNSDEQRIAQQLKHLILRVTKHGDSRKIIRTILDYCDDPTFTISSFRKRLLVWLDQTNGVAQWTVDQQRDRPKHKTSERVSGAKGWIDSLKRKFTRTNSRRSGVAMSPSMDVVASSWTISLRDRTTVLDEAALYISEQGKQPERIMIDQTPYVIGRDRHTVNLVNDDIQVSRIHAEIKRTEAGYVIRDLGSRNGTSLNEQKLTPYTEYPLHDKDKIQIGGACYRFQLEQGKSMV